MAAAAAAAIAEAAMSGLYVLRPMYINTVIHFPRAHVT